MASLLINGGKKISEHLMEKNIIKRMIYGGDVLKQVIIVMFQEWTILLFLKLE